MTDRDDRLDPERLARAIGTLGWRELEQLAHEVLGALALIVESNGAQRRDVSIARTHPEGSAPPASPMCACECPSRRDHWLGRLQAAQDRDMAAGGHPRLFRGAIVLAAEDLRLATRGPRQRPDASDASDMRGPERVDYILEVWAGLPAQRAAEIESARAGHITAGAIRRLRSANGYGLELGEPRDPDADVLEQVEALHKQGHLSDRDIARQLDLGKSSVSRMLKGRRRFDYDEAAA